MDKKTKEISILHLELTRLRIEHTLSKWRDLVPVENLLNVINKEFDKEIENIK